MIKERKRRHEREGNKIMAGKEAKRNRRKYKEEIDRKC